MRVFTFIFFFSLVTCADRGNHLEINSFYLHFKYIFILLFDWYVRAQLFWFGFRQCFYLFLMRVCVWVCFLQPHSEFMQRKITFDINALPTLNAAYSKIDILSEYLFRKLRKKDGFLFVGSRMALPRNRYVSKISE